MNLKSIFHYSDFRRYLAEYYDYKKINSPTFSYGTFSQKIGFKSRDFIYRVIHKEKQISPKSIQNISRGIGLNADESEYFELLVRFNQSKTGLEKNKVYSQLTQLKEKQCHSVDSTLLVGSDYKFFDKWYTPIIFNLLDIVELKRNFREFGLLLSPPITAKECKEAVKTLLDLGFVKRDDDGFYRVSQTHLSTQNELNSMGLLNYYIQSTKNAAHAIEHLPRSERNVSGITTSISLKTYQLLEEKINAFRKEIAEITTQDKHPERVYQINFQIIPVTKTIKPTENGREDND